MPPLIDLIGQRFGRLVVLRRNGIGPRKQAAWLCRCDCGNEKTIEGQTLRLGESRSCGCLNKDQKRQICKSRNTTHGLSKTPTYNAWAQMRQRCLNKRRVKYEVWGGRGIKICERWDSFENFLADMGERPSTSHSIDRIDNEGDYTPENCRWAAQWEQQNNRSNNRLITHQGRTFTLQTWAKLTGIKRETIARRLDRLGWPVDRALTVMPRRR